MRLNERGVEAVLKGDNKRGLQHLREGIKLDPGNPTIHYNLAGLFLNEGKISEALVEVNRCVAARPDDLSFLHRLGEVHFAAENFADAAEIFERIAEKNPEFNEVLFHLGTVYAMQKRWDKAESVLKRSLELYPSHVSLETNLANVLIMREKFSEASALLEKVNESEPSPEVSQTMGIAYEGKGELKKALQSYEKAVEQGSKDPQLSGRIEEIKKKIASKS